MCQRLVEKSFAKLMIDSGKTIQEAHESIDIPLALISFVKSLY